jgi:DNA polymerase III sliding clamp (beta) subunit (PCNA family)
MKLKRSELQAALKAVSPGVSAKDTIAQASSFVFDKDRVFSYNDEISVSAPFKSGFTGSVPAKEFSALINKLKGEEITLTVEKNELHVSSGKSQAGLRLEDEIKLPLEELGMPDSWTLLPKTFNEGIKTCLFSAGKDQTKYVLTHIHVNGAAIESSDGYRATRFYMEEGCAGLFPEPILIPSGAAKYVTDYKPTSYAVTNGWLHFSNPEGLVFSTRWPEGEQFPDISVFIDSEGDKITLPAELPDMMDRGAVLADGNRLTIILDKGALILATENDAGWFEEETKIDYKGDALEFDTYPEFLSSILKMKAEVSVTAKLMKFETDSMVHVVALLPLQKKGKK